MTVTRAASEPLHLTLSKLNAANERTSSLPSADGVDGASPRMSRAYSTASKASLTSLFRQSKAPGVELWKNSGSIVAEAISTRHGYDNLRDLCAGDIDYIYPDSLRHLKTLGIGTYAGEKEFALV